ncbi:MAG: PilX N-terminal domain-containing pilus assembly protein [Methylovulum sp.]|nr:PilX N-terminal domain-containing pilus assembly protein [Methylovulum sp.]
MRTFPYQRQSGAVLAIALVMLLLLMLIGISGTQMTSLEEREAGNEQDQNVAFQAAEATISAAEATITAALGSTSWQLGFSDEGTNGYYMPNSPALSNLSVTASADFWANNPSITYAGDTLNGVNVNNSPPKYLIQFILKDSSTPARCIYRIIAQASGSTGNSLVTVESIYAAVANTRAGGCL